MEMTTEKTMHFPEKSIPLFSVDSSDSNLLCCFICSRDSCASASANVNDLGDVKSDYLLHLRNIARFLQRFQGYDYDIDKQADAKVKGKSKSKSNSLEESLFLSRSILFICEDCSETTREFTELFKLSEEIRLHLDLHIQKILGVMTTKAKTETEVKVDNQDLLQKLRNQMTSQMKQINSFPRVVLRKASRRNDPTPPVLEKQEPLETRNIPKAMNVPIPVLSPEPGCESIPPSKSNSTNSLSSSKRSALCPQLKNILMGKRKHAKKSFKAKSRENRSTTNRGRVNPGPAIPQSKNSFRINFSSPSPISPTVAMRKAEPEKWNWKIKSKTCYYCNFKLKDTGRTRFDLMTKHFVRFHPEHYLHEVREEAYGGGVTETQFRRIIADILFPEFYPKNSCVDCKLCKLKYELKSKPEDLVVLKRHLLHWHSDQLKERLKVIQRDPELEAKLQSANPNGEFCKCQMYFPNWHSKLTKEYHERYYCCALKGREDENLPVECGVDENNVNEDVDADAEDENCCDLNDNDSDVATVMGIVSPDLVDMDMET